LEWKNLRLEGDSPKGNTKRICVGADLISDQWEIKLQQNGYDPSRPSVWIAEGLLPYLPEDKVKSLLKRISDISSTKSWFTADAANKMIFHLSTQKELMKKINAPWLFSTDYPEDLLKSCGWSNPQVEQFREATNKYRVTSPGFTLARWIPLPWPRGWFLNAQK